MTDKRKVYYHHPPRERIRVTELTKDGKLLVRMAWADKRSDEFYERRRAEKEKVR